MALPSSGPISGSQIATELSAASTNISLRSLSSTAGFSTPDAMSEFYGVSFPGVLLDTITPDGTGTTYTYTGNYNLNAYAGQSRRLVLQYTSGTNATGDLQIHSIFFNDYFHGPGSWLGSPYDYSVYNLETSRAAETDYSNATFYSVAEGTTANRWNLRAGNNTPSSGTGIDTSQLTGTRTYAASPSFYGGPTRYITYPYYDYGYGYIYAETSSPGYPNKDFWLRTTAQTIVSGKETSFYYVGYGATVGTLKVWLV